MPRALDALRVRDFRRFWLAAFVSNAGGWMQNAAIPYVVFDLTGAVADVGATGFLQYLPFMLMGPVGGALADRYPRRRLLAVLQLAQVVVALGLWGVVASGVATVASVAALAFLAGLLGGVTTPVWQAFVTELVPRDRLLGAITLNSAQFNAARAVGPFLAGVLIAVSGPAAAFAGNAVSFLVVFAVLLVIRGRTEGRPVVPRTGVVAGLVAAGRSVLATPAILACCVAIVAVAGLGAPLFGFLPVYGEEVFGVDGVALGLLLGAGGLGSVIAAPALLTLAPRVRRGVLLPAAMALYGVAVAGVGVSPTAGVAVTVLLVFGAAYLAIASTINTTIQLVVDESRRGMVIAVYLMCLTGALPVGSWLWGVAAAAVGLRTVTVVAGVALVLVTVALAVTARFAVMAAADDARDQAAAGGAPSGGVA